MLIQALPILQQLIEYYNVPHRYTFPSCDLTINSLVIYVQEHISLT